MNTKLVRIADKAKTNPRLRFTALAHLLTSDFLKETWSMMNRRGASGVDQETTQEFGDNLDARCESIAARLRARSYQAPPVRRVDIPKGDGKTRPLGIPTVEDRLVQRAVARILETIYETEFLNCSYGFRPGRGPHDAIRELRNQFMAGRVTTVFETDIRGYFNNLNHQWLMRMLRLRIGDPVILRLISKWLRAGALINGVVVRTEVGSPQGGPISPLLANIYLHYALDLWFSRRWAKECEGRVYLTRFADDYVAGFEYAPEARRFAKDVQERMKQFGLELAEEKTRLLTFGRLPFNEGKTLGSFDFLGFTHIGGSDRKGRFAVIRLPSRKSCRKFLVAVDKKLRAKMHEPPTDQQQLLQRMLQGFYQYFALNYCLERLKTLRYHVYRKWAWVLRRRSQKHKLWWNVLYRKPWFKLPGTLVVHPTV